MVPTAHIHAIFDDAGRNIERVDGGAGGARDPFWTTANRIMIHNSVEIFMGASGGRVDAHGLQRLIIGAAKSIAETADERWRADYHFRTLLAAKANAEAKGDSDDFNLAADYFMNFLPGLSDRTRSSIEAGVLGLLHVINTGSGTRCWRRKATSRPTCSRRVRGYF